MTPSNPAISPDTLEAARTLLATLGVSAEDLLGALPSERSTEVPTFAEFVPLVDDATPDTSSVHYAKYWQILVAEWGTRAINEPSASEIEALGLQVRSRAAARPGSRNGVGAQRSFIDAVKRFYACAVVDQLIDSRNNPAASLKKPTPPANRRRALSADQMTEVNKAAATNGLDPELDTLLLRLHTETACRRAAALKLRKCDINRDDCTVWLHEKGGRDHHQPISPTLMTALYDHTARRNPDGLVTDQLLRYRKGRPVGYSYYNCLWERIGQHLPWVANLGVTTHWIRYTTLKWVERNFGYAVAAAFAGHAVRGARSGTTLTYVEASLDEVATALATLTGEPHPLAPAV